MNTLRRRLLQLAITFFGASSTTVFAEPADDTGCTVRVRTLRGTDPSSEIVPKRLQLAKFADLGGQLEHLPYKAYEILNVREHVVAVDEVGRFEVPSAEGERHTVHVAPRPGPDDTVKLTVEWRESRGDELLTTSMRVPNGKNVVLGADGAGDASTIVDIRVRCPE